MAERLPFINIKKKQGVKKLGFHGPVLDHEEKKWSADQVGSKIGAIFASNEGKTKLAINLLARLSGMSDGFQKRKVIGITD